MSPSSAITGVSDVRWPVKRRWLEAMSGSQPVLTGLSNGELAGPDVGAAGKLAENLVECLPCFLLGCIAPPQLFSLSIDDAGVDRELIANNRSSARPALQFDSADLRRQLAALSHRRAILAAWRTSATSRRRLGVGRNEAIDLRRRDAASGTNLHPRKLAGLEESINGRVGNPQCRSSFRGSQSRAAPADLASGAS